VIYVEMCEGCEFAPLDNEIEDCKKRATRFNVNPSKCCLIYKLIKSAKEVDIYE